MVAVVEVEREWRGVTELSWRGTSMEVVSERGREFVDLDPTDRKSVLAERARVYFQGNEFYHFPSAKFSTPLTCCLLRRGAWRQFICRERREEIEWQY